MKVYIGPYKNWFGPYQLAEKLCFWAKKEKDEYGFDRTPDWVHNFGEWLAHGSVEPEPKKGDDPKKFLDREDRKETLLYKFLLWIESKRKRIIYVKIDRYDTWNMDSTLNPIILPMLKQLKATKHGSQIVDDEDVPEKFHTTYKEHDYDQLDLFPDSKGAADEAAWDLTHMRWEWVLDQMIWSFEQLSSDWESQFHTGKHDFYTEVSDWKEDGTPKLYQLKEGPEHTAKFDAEGYAEHSKRIDNGLRLFGKYYRGLWD
jgi:hypothetical protein